VDEINRDPGRNVAAIILIGLGVLFLAGQIFGGSLLGGLWPLIVMLPGFAFLYFAFTGDRNTAGFAVPGAMVTGTGLILLYQNLTGHWESWAYVWALYPVFLGMSLSFIGRRTGNEQMAQTSENFIRGGLIGFIALWALFELIIFGGSSFLISTALPLILILAGVYLLFRGQTRKSASYRSDEKPKYGTNGSRSSLQDQIDEALREPDEQEPRA
jgi:hypothetical protein